MLILGPFSIYEQPKQAGGLGYSPYLYFGCSYIEKVPYFVCSICNDSNESVILPMHVSKSK